MIWLWLFRLAVVADLLAIYFQWDTARLVTKPLIVLSLLIYFAQQVNNTKTGAALLKAALVFSIIGDVALLFENRDPLFFMVGLGSFLLSHVFYILAFNAIRKAYGGAGPWWLWIIAVAVYLGILLYILMPYLGELTIPVVVYALVLCGMLLMVAHAFRALYKKPAIICLAGALLFVLSDSILAINKFYVGFTLSGLVIMFTYAFAQYFLVTGAARVLKLSISHDTN